jgi:hypothetical protein
MPTCQKHRLLLKWWTRYGRNIQLWIWPKCTHWEHKSATYKLLSPEPLNQCALSVFPQFDHASDCFLHYTWNLGWLFHEEVPSLHCQLIQFFIWTVLPNQTSMFRSYLSSPCVYLPSIPSKHACIVTTKFRNAKSEQVVNRWSWASHQHLRRRVVKWWLRLCDRWRARWSRSSATRSAAVVVLVSISLSLSVSLSLSSYASKHGEGGLDTVVVRGTWHGVDQMRDFLAVFPPPRIASSNARWFAARDVSNGDTTTDTNGRRAPPPMAL